MIRPLNKRLWTMKFNRIIVYTPIVAIVNQFMIDKSLGVIDVPAFVIISLEDEPDREQVGGGQRDCVNQDENGKDGKNPRRGP